MLVSVFVCTFGDVVTYAGIAQEPYRSVSKMMMDATRQYPVTECGKALAPYISSLPCPVIVQISRCSLKKALKLLREYVEDNNVITDYTYSTIDDDTLYTCARTVYSTPYPKHIVWGTEEALDTFEEQFFTTPSPHRMLEGSLSDIMTRLFRECIVFSRSPLGHSMAYNKNTRSVIVRTQQYPYVDTFPLYKFCSMAVEWLAFSLEHVLSRILSGCRNDAIGIPGIQTDSYHRREQNLAAVHHQTVLHEGPPDPVVRQVSHGLRVNTRVCAHILRKTAPNLSREPPRDARFPEV